jgi:hypothetical protein
MADPFAAYHKALFVALDAGLSQSIYDFVPEDAVYPYVQIERHVTVQQNGLVARKDGVFTYLTVWSEYKGQKEVLEIMETIYTILNDAQLTLDAGRMVRCFVETRDTARDMDEQTFTGNVKLFTVLEHS